MQGAVALNLTSFGPPLPNSRTPLRTFSDTNALNAVSPAFATQLAFVMSGDSLYKASGSAWAEVSLVDPSIEGEISVIVGSLASHLANTANPHSVTKTQVGLSNVANVLQLAATNNLSDLSNVASARTSLALGSAATNSAGTAPGSVLVIDAAAGNNAAALGFGNTNTAFADTAGKVWATPQTIPFGGTAFGSYVRLTSSYIQDAASISVFDVRAKYITGGLGTKASPYVGLDSVPWQGNAEFFLTANAQATTTYYATTNGLSFHGSNYSGLVLNLNKCRIIYTGAGTIQTLVDFWIADNDTFSQVNCGVHDGILDGGSTGKVFDILRRSSSHYSDVSNLVVLGGVGRGGLDCGLLQAKTRNVTVIDTDDPDATNWHSPPTNTLSVGWHITQTSGTNGFPSSCSTYEHIFVQNMSGTNTYTVDGVTSRAGIIMDTGFNTKFDNVASTAPNGYGIHVSSRSISATFNMLDTESSNSIATADSGGIRTQFYNNGQNTTIVGGHSVGMGFAEGTNAANTTLINVQLYGVSGVTTTYSKGNGLTAIGCPGSFNLSPAFNTNSTNANVRIIGDPQCPTGGLHVTGGNSFDIRPDTGNPRTTAIRGTIDAGQNSQILLHRVNDNVFGVFNSGSDNTLCLGYGANQGTNLANLVTLTSVLAIGTDGHVRVSGVSKGIYLTSANGVAHLLTVSNSGSLVVS